MDLVSFTTGYTAQELDQISFDWNGKHAKEFMDTNQQFRREVISFVLENDQLYFPVELIRDLFLEEAKWSVQAWSVGFDFHKLGEKLIRFGKEKFLNDFLVGAYSSFDTYCSSRMMNLERFEVESVLKELRRRISEADTGFKDLYESGIKLFESYLQGNQRDGLFTITGNIKATNIRIVKQNKIKNIIRKVYKKITRNL